MVGARAALVRCIVHHRVHGLDEGRKLRERGGVGSGRCGGSSRSSGGGSGSRGVGSVDTSLEVGGVVASAALGLLIGLLASGLLALQLALGLGAVGGLDAFVEARQVLADGCALGGGGVAGGVAVSGLAHALALGAAVLLASVLGATNGAHGLLAVDGALRASDLLALHLAFRPLANRMAHRRASRVIALPFADRVALYAEANGARNEMKRPRAPEFKRAR